MIVIGLTGGIGSGKSTVADLFAKYHVPIIDADKIARELTLPNTPEFIEIVKHFGTEILKDNQLDRKKLRSIIFQHSEEKKWLEALLHPQIQKKIALEIKKISAPYCIAVIPLLLEAEAYEFIDRILVIDATEELQIERVIKRDNLSNDHIKTILKAQVPRNHRLDKAHDVILNIKKKEDLIPQIEKLHEKYLQLATGGKKK